MIAIIFVLIILAIILFKLRKKFKSLKLDCITLINGGVKCGKTTLAVHLAIKNYRKNLIIYYIRSFFQKLFKKKVDEKPLLYSNIPLTIPYVPVTKDMLLRKTRMNFKSVVLLSESSLVISSQDYQDPLINESTHLFFKLFGHETHGGKMFIETQNISDNHYSVKRAINKYVWIHTLQKNVPFFMIYLVREMYYADDNDSVTNVFNEDIDSSVKYLVISKRVWMKFDRYCYSGMTDNLSSETSEVVDVPSLKLDEFVSFKKWLTLNKKKEVKKLETK